MKKSFLACVMAAVMTVSAVSPAWAVPKSNDDGEYAAVTVKNVKGGLLAVGIIGDKTIDYIPIGETVEVPIGTELEIENMTISYRDSDKKSTRTYLKKLDITCNGESDFSEEYPGDEYVGPETYTVEGNTVISGEFVGGETTPSSDKIFFGSDKAYPSEIKLTNEKLLIEYNNGTNHVDVNGKDIDVTITNAEYYGNDVAFQVSPEDFTIADGAISSKEVLPLGNYGFDLDCVYKGETYTDLYFNITIGYETSFGAVLGEYKSSSSSTRPIKLDGGRAVHYYDDNYNLISYFDGHAETVNSMYEQLKKNNEVPGIYGYERTAWTDSAGKVVKMDKTLSDVSPNDSYPQFYGVYKNGNKTYKPVTIAKLDETPSEVKEGWVEENGKWYFYRNNELVTDKWVTNSGFEYYLGKDGAMVTDGIAGTGEDRYLVDKDGKIRTDYTGIYEDEGSETTYDIVNGKVVKEHIVVSTPSNADKVVDLADKLLDGKDTIPDEDKAELVDKLIVGLEKLSSADKKKLTEENIGKLDEALRTVFNNITLDQSVDTGKFTGDAAIPSDGAEFLGIIAGAGLRSDMLDDSEIEITVKTTQKATKSNADKKYTEEIRVAVELSVNGENVEPKGPVVMKLDMPDDFVASYSNAQKKYKAVHEKNDGSKVTTDTPDLGEDGSVFTYKTDSFSEFSISSSKKTNTRPDSGGSSSGGGGRGGSVSQKGASGKWMQDENGWWFTYNGGGYPTLKWELINGEWYYFNQNGYMATGWQVIQDRWFYLDASGAMKTGWKQDEQDGRWYYLGTDTGAMRTGWQEIQGVWYYLNPVSDGTDRPLGSMFSEETTPDGYYVDANGGYVE